MQLWFEGYFRYMERKNYTSGAPWEVQIGDYLEISGTVATDENGVVGPGNPYEQTKFILAKMGKVLNDAGFTFEHVVRTRMFVTDISKWEEIGRAHGEVFGKIKPATSMVEVSRLIDDAYLVEIEITARK
jgi:enamine deaminase RidA (YjgF/YER057c/UK114 family)